MRQKKLFFLAGIISLMLILSPFNGAFAADTITLKVANFFPPPANQSKLLAAFLSELESRTNGKVKSKYFPGGSLLKAPATIKGVEHGIADIGLAHISYTAGRFPEMEILELPLGLPTAWVANQIMNDFYYKYKPKEFNKYKVLWFHANSPSLMITKDPIRKLEDFKGKTLRAPGRAGEIIRALGGNAAPTPIMETYDAIAKGVIQGVFVPFETLKTFKFAEVAKYVTVSWAVGASYPFYVAMNKKAYAKLTPDVKEVFDKLTGEYKEKYAMMWNAIEFGGKAFGKTKGMEYIELSKAESDRWVKAAQPVIKSYAKAMVKKGISEAETMARIKWIKERAAQLLKMQAFYQIKSTAGPAEVRP